MMKKYPEAMVSKSCLCMTQRDALEFMYQYKYGGEIVYVKVIMIHDNGTSLIGWANREWWVHTEDLTFYNERRPNLRPSQDILEPNQAPQP